MIAKVIALHLSFACLIEMNDSLQPFKFSRLDTRKHLPIAINFRLQETKPEAAVDIQQCRYYTYS